MAAEPIWTTEFLSDSAWAFRRLVERAPTAELDDDERQNIRQVEDWLRVVEPLVKGAQPRQQFDHVPTLGLSQTQLNELTAKIVGSGKRSRAHAHRLAILAHPWEHLHRQVRHLTLTSWLIFAGLVGLVGLNALYLLILRDLPRPIVLESNLGVAFLVIGVWSVHHFRVLLRHEAELDAHLMAVIEQHA